MPTRAVETGDAPGLRALLEPCAAVIACAGPFCEHGEPVVAAAAETGTNYLDTTGEQPFIALVFDRYGPAAERSGAALVTAMGFDYVPGDMIAALTAEGIGPLEEITLAYSVRGLRMTRGTTLSGIGMLTAAEFEFVDGGAGPAIAGSAAAASPSLRRSASSRWPATPRASRSWCRATSRCEPCGRC